MEREHSGVRFGVGNDERPEGHAAGKAPALTIELAGELADVASPVVLPASEASLSGDPARYGLWSGTVRARNGSPIPGATVRVRGSRNVRLGDDSLLDGDDWITLTAGDDGGVAFEYLKGFEYEIEVRAPGFGLERFGIQGEVGQELVLDGASALTGRVVMDGSGAPLSDASVVFENAFERYETKTDADGQFRFEGVGARIARVQVSGGSFVAVARSVEGLPPGGSATLGDVAVQTGSLLVGEVVADGQVPLEGAAVTLVDRTTRQAVSQGVSDASGRFTFHSISPSRQYSVIASGYGYRADTHVGSAFVSLHVTPTWTLGMVLSSPFGSAAGAKVRLQRQDGLPFQGNETSLEAAATAQGLVAFTGLSRDVAYRVVVGLEGHATVDFGPLTAAWNEDLPLVIGLVPGESVAGTIVDENGEPVGGVTLRAQRVDGFPAPPLFATANALGKFTFGSVIAAGEISLVTFKSGYDNTREVVTVPAGAGAQAVQLKIQSLLAIADVK